MEVLPKVYVSSLYQRNRSTWSDLSKLHYDSHLRNNNGYSHQIPKVLITNSV